MTDVAPTGEPSPSRDFPIVGIGASAGGLEAISRLLEQLPADTGMALVVVQHLHPAHPSALVEILARATTMKVSEALDEPEVEPDHVYVIPPGRDMVIADGRLRVFPREGRRHPIDLFFRSLAEAQGEKAIGVVLSGTGSDGSLGLAEIKGAGGVTIAQDSSAKHDTMPRSAIAQGCVDLVLSPERIADELARLSSHPYLREPPQPAEPERVPGPDGMAKVLALLREAGDVDFSAYKPATLSRRIQRRMLLHGLGDVDAYARFLADHPPEVDALYQDVLINVTSFFRDPEVFQALETKVFPRLVKRRPASSPLRAWTLGCSTGEEAYSLAIAFTEFCEKGGFEHTIQVFASDVNPRGIEKARAGVYPKSIVDDVSPERLRRFFVEVEGGYAVNRQLRATCVFAHHNVVVDPPFSRLDVITCRNMLIYLDAELQRRLIPVLHYALEPGGFLVLGRAETIGSHTDLFELRDARNKIFEKLPAIRRAVPTARLTHRGAGVVAHPPTRSATPPREALLAESSRLLLDRYVPASVLVDAGLEVLQFHGDTSPFLSPASGRASLHLLKMARPELVAALRSAVREARESGEPVRKEALAFASDDGPDRVDLEVAPLGATPTGASAFLVLFLGRRTVSSSNRPIDARRSGLARRLGKLFGSRSEDASAPAAEREIARLGQELTFARDYAQSLAEQADVAGAELQTATEEAQSSNEELQSINEELETSKEELQSSNEELTTVNDELNTSNQELLRANSDLVNLFGCIDVPVVMLGADLRIRRFNDSAERVMSLVPGDIGRPVRDVTLNVQVDVATLVEQVIANGATRELELRDKKGRWFMLRIRPYTTSEQRVEGAVVALIDIDSVRRGREFAETVIRSLRHPLVVLDPLLRVRMVNDSFCEAFRVSAEQTQGRRLYDLGDREWDVPELRELLEDVLPGNRRFDDFVIDHDFPGIGRRRMLLSARKLDPAGSPDSSILLVIEDTTERTRLGERVQVLSASDKSKSDFLAMLSHELRSPLNAIRGWVSLIGRENVPQEDLRQGIEAIDRSSRLQAKLIEDIFEAQQLASGKTRLERTRVDLAEVVVAAIQSAVPSAAQKRLRLVRDLEQGPIEITGDAHRLQQVFGNLLVNAIKFTSEGEVRVALRREGDRARVTVADTGSGISREALPHLFQPFHQADPSTSRGHGGLGLGLAIAKQFVTLHGGTLEAESPGRDQGATFTVTLPLATVERIAAVDDGAPHRAHESLAGILVLVVDDEIDAREPLRRVLEEAGAEVVTAASTDEALLALQRRLPRVVVSDIGMPVRDGYDLVRSIRELPPQQGGALPVIALSSYSSPEERERARSRGFDVHFGKPVESDTLIAAIAAFGRGRAPAAGGTRGLRVGEPRAATGD